MTVAYNLLHIILSRYVDFTIEIFVFLCLDQGNMDAIKDSRERIKHREATLSKLLRERIVLIDGAMGTIIEKCKLTEEGFRG